MVYLNIIYYDKKVMSITCYIVDDERHNVVLLSEEIDRSADLTLIGASVDSETALLEIREKRPDVVFSDINMPQMSGIKLASLIDSFTKVVFVSGELQSKFSGEINQNLYLKKPLSSRRFSEVVNYLKTVLNK